MKFGKTFEKALEAEDLPEEWKAAAIKYKSLKKCINKVVEELESLGLTTETINDLLQSSARGHTAANSGPSSIEYQFDGTTRSIQPRLCFTIESDSQLAELSSKTRTALKELLKRAGQDGKGRELHKTSTYDPVASAVIEERLESLKLEGRASPTRDFNEDRGTLVSSDGVHIKHAGTKTIQIHLDSDTEFFDMLGDEVNKIDTIQSREQATVLRNIDTLGSQLSTLVRPSNKGKSNPDLESWRKLLRLWEDAGIFKPASEAQRRNHTPEKAAKQLTWYMEEVNKAGILKDNPKDARSQALYRTFGALNLAILQQIKFHSMNQQAMNKILKKFDKRTSLTARTGFPTFMAHEPFFTDGLGQAMHYAVASNLLSIVPQMDDYECPVCTSITVKPVRLSCSHVFCVRCLIRLQMAKENHCPICRRENVLSADSTNIDWALLNFLKMYFPIEAKEKQKANEKEQLKITAEAAGMNGKGCCIM